MSCWDEIDQLKAKAAAEKSRIVTELEKLGVRGAPSVDEYGRWCVTYQGARLASRDIDTLLRDVKSAIARRGKSVRS